MMERNNYNLLRYFMLPLCFTFIFIVLLAYLTFNQSVNQFRKTQQEDGVYITELFSNSITKDLSYRNLLETSMNERLISAGEVVIANREHLSNQYLNDLLDIFGVQELFWYSPEGEIVYDALDSFVGWKSEDGDPIYQFIHSDKDVYFEEMRKSTDSDEYFKFAYLKDSDGYFVQIGYTAEYFSQYIEEYSFQNIVDNLVNKDDNILYAYILNKDLETLADSQLENIDYQNNNFQQVLEGETIVSDFYNVQRDLRTLEILTPLVYEGEIIGIVSVGLCVEQINKIQLFLVTMFMLLIIGIISSYLVFQFWFVLYPIHRLSNTINSITYNQQEQISSSKNNVFKGVYDSIQYMITRLNNENEKNEILTNEIKYVAYHDYLTKLPNRLSFMKHLESLLDKNGKFAIIFIDMDDFKEYNDINGHFFGDRILISVANRLQDLTSDSLFVSRYGGDEFIIAKEYKDIIELDDFIRVLKLSFNQPFYVDDALYPVNISGGICLYPDHATTIDDLIRKSNIAMCYSKSKGKNKINILDEDIENTINREISIINTLKTALYNDGFTLVYQPQVDINTKKIISFEALLRLKTDLYSPSDFIPHAESAGLIIAIGRVVIEKVIRQLADWKQRNLDLKTIYVNFSTMQIDDDDIVDFIKDLLEEYNIKAKYLGIELTESAIIDKDEKVIKLLSNFAKMGIHTSLDDFGSGQAGINYLTKFDVDMVKIDKGFVDKYLHPSKMKIFNTVFVLAEMLGFIIMVEGVETSDQIKLLKTTRCHLVQGFYFYKPLNPHNILEIYDKEIII